MVSEKKHSQVGGRNRIMLPLPPSGLPDGWSMEQWEEYGQEWYDENPTEFQGSTTKSNSRKYVKLLDIELDAGNASDEINSMMENREFWRKSWGIPLFIAALLSSVAPILFLVEGWRDWILQDFFIILISGITWAIFVLSQTRPRLIPLYPTYVKFKFRKKSRVCWDRGEYSRSVGIMLALSRQFDTDTKISGDLSSLMDNCDID